MTVPQSPSPDHADTRAALLVSHGQPSDPHPAEEQLRKFADKLALLLPGWQIGSATLALPDRLETVLAEMPAGALIYPLFMSDGWFVRTALPRRLGDAPVRILPPLGADPDLPEAVANDLAQQLETRGWAAPETDLLIASHGSARSAYSQKATDAFAQRVRQLTRFRAIHTGFVEQEPSLENTARLCGGQALCLPFFFAEGGHVREDVDDTLRETGFAGPRLAVLAGLPATPRLIANSLRTALRAQTETA